LNWLERDCDGGQCPRAGIGAGAGAGAGVRPIGMALFLSV